MKRDEQIRRERARPFVVTWQDGWEATNAAVCGPVSDCVGVVVPVPTEVVLGPQIEEMGVA